MASERESLLGRVKFLDPREVEATLTEVGELFRVVEPFRGREVSVVGGVAMMAYGSDRMTKDVDVAVVGQLPPELAVVKMLSSGGAVCRTPGGRLVDVVVRSDEYRDLYVEAVEESVDVGLPVPVVTPEHLAATKMAASRSKDESDLRFLLKVEGFDLDRAMSIVRHHLGRYAARELDAVVAEVEWKRSREGER